MTVPQYPHLADATFAVVTELRRVSDRLREAEPADNLKRWALACDMCRTAGADFSLDPEDSPSPLAQIVDAISNSAVRVVTFDHDRDILTLHPWGVGETSVDIPLAWFDDALVMVDREWGAMSYPYEAPLLVVNAERVDCTSDAICYPDWIYAPNMRGELDAQDRATREAFYRARIYDVSPQLSQLSTELLGLLASLKGLATSFGKQYVLFAQMEREHYESIPGAGRCEAELAFFARPEIRNLNEAVWDLQDQLDLSALQKKAGR